MKVKEVQPKFVVIECWDWKVIGKVLWLSMILLIAVYGFILIKDMPLIVRASFWPLFMTMAFIWFDDTLKTVALSDAAFRKRVVCSVIEGHTVKKRFDL